MVRAPVAQLTILDDGSTRCGETWRLRKPHTVIGRSEGEIRLDNDPDVSAQHAEVIRRKQHGVHNWYLMDCDSTNGTFVRVRRHALRSGQELLLGGRKYQFLCQDTLTSESLSAGREQTVTRRLQAPTAVQMSAAVPQLVERRVDESECRYSLMETGILIGRDPQRCGVCIDDPFLDSVHAECFLDERHRWIIRDRASLNGIWIRVQQLHLHPGTEFQLGGQRLRFDLT